MDDFQKQLIEIMKTRRSIRRFKEEPIPRATLEILMDVAQYAPCPSGYMVWEFVVVDDPEKVKSIRGALKVFIKVQVPRH